MASQEKEFREFLKNLKPFAPSQREEQKKNVKEFNDFLETNLNEQQKKAVVEKNGIFLVVAGAGSGKTRVITSRIAHLIINEGVAPHTIVALTFTNKAANEMKDRIRAFLNADTALPFLGTFHSYCLRILRTHANKLDKPFEAILDQDDQIKILNGIIKRNGLNKQITAKKLAYNISQIKNRIVGSKEEVMNMLSADPLLRDAYSAYEYEKNASKCYDFDDLLVETVRLFDRKPEFKREFQEHVKHILVDEYQDTNVVQHVLLKHMALDNNNKCNADSLCVVGDEDQSIYSWRGATIANIINFKKDFKNSKLIKIEQNYRSVQPILDAANKVIQNNQKRNPKKLWSNKPAKDRIRNVRCSSEYHEGDVVTQFLQISQTKQSLNNVAILYRAHYQSRAIEEALIRNSIPYKIIGGIQFYERKEIKDMLAHVRLVVNPFDRPSFFRVINCPTRGLGPKFEEQFYNCWNQNILSGYKEIADMLIKNKEVTPTKASSLRSFVKIFDTIDEQTKPSNAIKKIITNSGYKEFLKNSCDKNEAETRIDNLKELINATQFMEEQGTKTISEFLEEVALMQESSNRLGQEEQKDQVTLMTLHAAKGLEFDTIIIVGVEEGILPSSRSLHDDDATEEERRLFYVGMTRAKERLLLSSCDYRYAFGQTSYQIESRFLKEIPCKLQHEEDFTRASTCKIDTTFCNWLGITQERKSSQVFTFGPSKAAAPQEKRANKRTKAPVTRRGKSNKHKKNTFSDQLLNSDDTPTAGKWRKNQPVSHKTFGVGVIQKVEHRGEDKLYITAKFKKGVKMLDAKFLEIL